MADKRIIHISLVSPKVRWPKPVSPTIDEIEETLPGFKEQYLPKIMTPDILEELFPYVQKVANKDHATILLQESLSPSR